MKCLLQQAVCGDVAWPEAQRDAARYYGYRTDGGVARQRRLLRRTHTCAHGHSSV